MRRTVWSLVSSAISSTNLNPNTQCKGDPIHHCSSPTYQPFIHNQSGDSFWVRHYFRRIPDVSGESSNPLSSAFTSSNNLSSPLFLNCVCRATVLALVVQIKRGGGNLDARAIFFKDCLTTIYRTLALQKSTTVSRSCLFITDDDNDGGRVGKGRQTCLRTSR